MNFRRRKTSEIRRVKSVSGGQWQPDTDALPPPPHHTHSSRTANRTMDQPPICRRYVSSPDSPQFQREFFFRRKSEGNGDLNSALYVALIS
ncbi:hypothetical protein J6590_055497 [Homalodisca vitripennis]|nr:hypothetical protein J6590_055497 [Homalodisca vitripennis]